MLQESGIDLKEVFVYKTHLIPKQFNRSFDAVLCFSPSGVDSIFKLNASLDSNLICIGNTTATQARDYSKRVYVSSKTSVESLIVKSCSAFTTLTKNPAVWRDFNFKRQYVIRNQKL